MHPTKRREVRGISMEDFAVYWAGRGVSENSVGIIWEFPQVFCAYGMRMEIEIQFPRQPCKKTACSFFHNAPK